jgi:regulator of replication initiation timing
MPAKYKHLGDVYILCLQNTCFMPEEKRKISVWVPAILYDNVLQVGYTSPTHAVIQGFEMLIQAMTEESPEAIREQMQAIRGQMQAEINNLKSEIERLNTSLQEAPSPLELVELRARYGEMEKHNETLKKELEKAGQDKEVIQNLYNNYMLQRQTLINQKAIEAPGTKKKWWQFW